MLVGGENLDIVHFRKADASNLGKRFTLFACRANGSNLGLLPHHTSSRTLHRILFLRIRFSPLLPDFYLARVDILRALSQVCSDYRVIFFATHSTCVLRCERRGGRMLPSLALQNLPPQIFHAETTMIKNGFQDFQGVEFPRILTQNIRRHYREILKC